MPWGREPTVMVVRRVCLPAQLSSVQSLEKMPALVHRSHQQALKILDHPCFTLTHKEQCTIVLESVSHLTLRVTFQGSQWSQNRVNLIPTRPFSLQSFLSISATSVRKWGEAAPTSSNCLRDWGRAHPVQELLKELFPQYSSKAQQFSSLTKNWPEAEPSLLFLFPAPDSPDSLLGARWTLPRLEILVLPQQTRQPFWPFLPIDPLVVIYSSWPLGIDQLTALFLCSRVKSVLANTSTTQISDLSVKVLLDQVY